MARIRSLKPEFWDDRKLARSACRDARMLYMGLWNQADEHGRLNGDLMWLKGRIFPYDDDITTERLAFLLGQLERATCIVRYEVDGDPFIYLPKLGRHQRLEPDKVESRLPEPPSESRADPDADSSERRADQSVPDASSSALLYVAGSMEHVAGSMEAPRKPQRAATKRGTRLDPDWRPSDDTREWTLRRLSQPDAAVELEKFHNYWLAKTGKDATKLDWDRTWRNWVLNSRASPPNGRSTTDQRVQDGLALAARLRAEQPKEVTGASHAS